MKFFDLFRTALNEESLPNDKSGILLLDIDDTLLKSNASEMKIYRKLPSDKEEVALTSAEYAKENVTPALKKYYDYRDFRDSKKVYNSIVKGMPLINNLKAVDAFVQGGYELGILTARGCEDAVASAIKAFLRVRDEKGNLVRPAINRENIHAVNDDDKVYPGNTDFEKKQNVLRSYASKFDYVYFFDDDPKNLNALKALKKSDPEISNKLRSIDAKKNIEEGVLFEMAVKDVTSDIINALKNEDYGKALVLYFNIVKDQASYAGKKDAKSAFKHMLSFGITRTFGALEKKGELDAGTAEKLKSFGLQHIDELSSQIDYEGNPDYVAPKRNNTVVRKKLAAMTVEELEKRIERYKSYGWKSDWAIKEGSTKTKPHFYYVYITGKSDLPTDDTKSVNEDVLIEMALKDVTPEMKTLIKNKDYRAAVQKYFDSVKGQPTYAKLESEGAKFKHMLSYGLSRTFNALEKKGELEPGTVKEMKKVAEGMQHDYDSATSSASNSTEPAGQKAEKTQVSKVSKPVKKETTYEKTSDGAISKISDRISHYQDLAKKIEDYVYTSKYIKPFAVNTRKNGIAGVDDSVKKPKISDESSNDILKSKSQRYVDMMQKFKGKFLPDYIQQEALKKADGEWKRNLEIAERMGPEYLEATKIKLGSDYMVRVLNNMFYGWNEFRNNNKDLSGKDLLKELKTNVDFPYDDFVKIDNWFKTAAMNRDKDEHEQAIKTREKVKSASLPPEVAKVMNEYITYANQLERALANGKAGEFFSIPVNYAVASAALEIGNDLNPKESDKTSLIEPMKNFMKASKVEEKLVPVLKDRYSKRYDESKNEDYSSEYKEISKQLDALKIQRQAFEHASDSDNIDKVDIKLDKLGDKIIDVILDRLIAVDMVASSANQAVFNDFEKAAEKYSKIRVRKMKAQPEKASSKNYDPSDPKYKKYYNPSEDEPDEDEEELSSAEINKYKAISDAVEELSFDELVAKKLVVVKGVNLKYKRYSEDEVNRLYDALSKSKEELYKLLSTPEFSALRKA